MAIDNTSKINPALKPLKFLLGDWEMELSNAVFLPDPKTTIEGEASFEWIESGAFLVMRMGEDATWLISRDGSMENYKIFYFDTRMVSRVYEMSLTDDTWKIWRNSPDFSQRFEGKIDTNHKIINAYWEKSMDGKKWEHDFDVMYRKK